MDKLFWPVVIIFGILGVIFIDQGNGLNSPFFWLIPIGLIGGFISLLSRSDVPIKNRLKSRRWLISIWLAALLSIAGLFFGWFTDGFGVFIWALLALVFTILGLIMLTISLFKKS